MAPTAEPAETYTRWQRFQLAVFSLLGRLLIRGLGATLSYVVEGEGWLQQIQSRGQPSIMVFWHNQIISAAHYFRFRGIFVLASVHFDGESIARMVHSLGYGTVRGSSTRGGVRALLELRRLLETGTDVAFTLDGPRGPRYQAKPGPILLARKTGVPIVAFHLEPRRFWEVNSWDGLRIPKPFTSVHLRFAEPLYVKSDTDVEEGRERLQAELDRLRAAAASFSPSAF